MAILEVAILLAVVLSLTYAYVTVVVWTTTIAVVLVLMTVFGSLGFVALTIFWLFFLAAAAFANLNQQRLRYFTHPLLKKLQKTMPSISPTEREAIDAGDVWWEKDLFCGRPQWKKLLGYPVPTLSTEEESFLANQVETLCSMLDDWKVVHEDHDLPPAVWEYLKKERFFGMGIPKVYGGREFSALAHSTVVIKIATRSISAAVDTMVPNSLGPAELLLHYGTEEQKSHYLPKLAIGEEMPCFALTSPEAGSDAGSISDFGVICHGEYEGKQVLGMRLTWDKRYITLAPVATVLGLAFRLYDPDHLLGTNEDLGITLCLVPTGNPGVEIGHRHLPMNMAFMNGPTRGKDVFLPLDAIIGGVARVGQGWRMLMESLSVGRSISLPALSAACAKLTYRTTGAYSRVRKQFNTSISNFEGVEEALGDIAGLAYTIEACRIMTAGAVDQKISPSIASAIAKYHMTEAGRKIMNHAMDIHGGHAIQNGPRNFLANAYMAMPVSITVEGANILTRNLIIFGQGAIRCHPFVLREVELISVQDEKNEVELNKMLLSHAGYFMSNFVRSFLFGLSGGMLICAPVSGKTAKYSRQLTRMSSALALLSDTCMMILGGALKRKERISARLGDMLSELYIASSILKYHQDCGKKDEDLDSVQWGVENCLYNIQVACNELLDNFPIKFLGKLLRFIIFPFGAAYSKPSDALTNRMVTSMLQPSEFRDRLTKYCYVSAEADDPIRRLETALSEQIRLDPLLKKLQNALRNGTVSHQGDFKQRVNAAVSVGALTAEEGRALSDYDSLQQEVIKVDEFSFDLQSVLT
jgi:acyl-CoA dehydrogenase